MGVRYATSAVNDDGGEGHSSVPGGLAVRVGSPLQAGFPETAETTNPEQLLALAWATCLNATAQAILRSQGESERRTTVRIEVELRDANPGHGFEFWVNAFLSLAHARPGEAEELLAAAHARCPVSKLLREAATVHVQTEEYSPLSVTG